MHVRFGGVFGALLLFVALGAAGCGRKGPLEPPPGVPPVPPAVAAARQTTILDDGDRPGLIQSRNRIYEVPAPVKLQAETAQQPRPINAAPAAKPSTFFLDPLLN